MLEGQPCVDLYGQPCFYFVGATVFYIEQPCVFWGSGVHVRSKDLISPLLTGNPFFLNP